MLDMEEVEKEEEGVVEAEDRVSMEEMRESVEEKMQKVKEWILEDVKKIQKLVFVVWRSRSVSAVLRRSQSWSALTRM